MEILKLGLGSLNLFAGDKSDKPKHIIFEHFIAYEVFSKSPTRYAFEYFILRYFKTEKLLWAGEIFQQEVLY